MIAISIGVLSSIGTHSDIPSPAWGTTRIDLLASRDLEVSGAIPAGGDSDKLPLVADQTWTRTGGESCYPISSTDASCFADSEIPYTVDATGIGWAVEPDSINRVLYSTAIDCTNWLCTGSPTITTGQSDPAGGTNATTIATTGADYIRYSGSGYTASAPLFLHVWVKCSAGTLYIDSSAGYLSGRWAINCATVGGEWTLARSASQSFVTESFAHVATVAGNGGVKFIGAGGAVTATVWAPTLTEEPGTGLSVIPTAASAVSTGDAAWVIDNTSTNYYRAGDTVTQTITEISGTCWVVSGTDLLLTGAAGSECSGIWYGLQVAK